MTKYAGFSRHVLISGPKKQHKCIWVICVIDNYDATTNNCKNDCDTWKPTDPGDTLSQVYSTIAPDEETPLVLVLEECDKILFDVLDGKIVQHKQVLIQVREKSDWNGMLDKVTDLGFYPHLILILTSNVCVEKINERDKSLLRKGRIDKTYHI